MEIKKTNIGELYRDKNGLKKIGEGSAEYCVYDLTKALKITKKVDHDNCVYFSGDEIEFVITIQNLSKVLIDKLYFKDAIDPIILPITPPNYNIITTHGNIVSLTSPITINNISLNPNETCTIKIKGICA